MVSSSINAPLLAHAPSRPGRRVSVLIVAAGLLFWGLLFHVSWRLREAAVEELAARQCQTLPYKAGKLPRLRIEPAEALGPWGACPAPAPPFRGLAFAATGAASPAKRGPMDCRRFRVPLDYEEGVAAGTLVLTVGRGRRAASGNQMWVLQGGPGAPSHPLLGLMDVDGFTSLALDHRGTGWSSVLDCPRVRSGRPGALPFGDMWLHWVGLGNVTSDVLRACLAEVSETIGAPRHFTATNAARDLAAVIMALQKEEGHGDVGLQGFSYGTLWSRRFMMLQGKEFPILARHVGLDGAVSAGYDFGQYSLASESVGTTLLHAYCGEECKRMLGISAQADAYDALKAKVLDIGAAAHGGGGGPCGEYLWKRFAKDVVKSGWAAASPIKESLGAFAYMAVTHQSAAETVFNATSMARYVRLVSRLHRCIRDAEAGDSQPKDYESVTRDIDDFASSAEGFYRDQPEDFSSILHHVVTFGEMWAGPPELSSWGADAQHSGACTLGDWQAYFAKNVVWAPDFVTLTQRFKAVFDEVGYRELDAVVRSDVAYPADVSVFITGADLDGMTPFRVGAEEVYTQLQTCKAVVELRTGGHCVSGTRCVHPASLAFFQTPHVCNSSSIEPRRDTNFSIALAQQYTPCNAHENVRWDVM